MSRQVSPYAAEKFEAVLTLLLQTLLEALDDEPIDGEDYLLLDALANNRTLTVGEAGRILRWKAATCSHRLDRLQELQLVKRGKPAQGDRRSFEVFLTTTGKKKHQEIHGRLAKRIGAKLADLSSALGYLLRALSRPREPRGPVTASLFSKNEASTPPSSPIKP